jgi:hypothetical protein
MTDTPDLPAHYWHCYVRVLDGHAERDAIINDLSLEELTHQIVAPWHRAESFPVAGLTVHNRDAVREIRIVHTPFTKHHGADTHYKDAHAAGVVDHATDSRLLPFQTGVDHTSRLLFPRHGPAEGETNVQLILRVCERLHLAVHLLAKRGRNKPPVHVADEYDVEDLLSAVLRTYVDFTVTEEPMDRLGAPRSGRAAIAIEDVGVVVRCKYARDAVDRQRLVDEFAADIELYSQWQALRHFVYYIYNATVLDDPHALRQLTGEQQVAGRRFRATVVLGG